MEHGLDPQKCAHPSAAAEELNEMRILSVNEREEHSLLDVIKGLKKLILTADCTRPQYRSRDEMWNRS